MSSFLAQEGICSTAVVLFSCFVVIVGGSLSVLFDIVNVVAWEMNGR
jgi:hypothetical protein